MENMTWTMDSFGALSAHELYEVVRLRHDVFIVEQANPVVEFDGAFDFEGLHLRGLNRAGLLMAYARLLPPGLKTENAVIGRVLTAAEHRGKGLGEMLMKQCITFGRERFPGHAFELSSQCHAAGFYENVGFTPTGPVYDEDGIPHQRMLLGSRSPVCRKRANST